MRTVARSVRAARARLGLSLDRLAQRSGVSKGALVALENGTGNPNLTTLVRLADALAVPVSALVESAPSAGVHVVRADEIDPLWRGASDGTVRLLFTTPGPAPLELWDWRMRPGEHHRSAPHPAGTHETLTVTAGTTALTVDGTEYALPEGASAHYAADVAHGYACAGDEPCAFLMTVHLPAAPAAPPDPRQHHHQGEQ
ncbi:XRE family transcriptional regulator [Murinocardiopsis flavida]|uniref:XRE family transcriptional regulator n=1 Tax=Murinocardiopsis flavida TaxID=645275 RepID=A0A2P8D3E2_9ACTN|nr:XRE family transcriptional regulator [Murinocardiopsis flavida]